MLYTHNIAMSLFLIGDEDINFSLRINENNVREKKLMTRPSAII